MAAAIERPKSPAPSAPAVPLRLRHVDGLRAVAAGLVMWHHFHQMLAPVAAADPWIFGFLRAVPAAVDLGRLGIFLFFAISGFVICRSFGGPREGGARRFLLKRACRLYPAFWVSMLAGVYVRFLTGQPVTWTILAANATMIPATLGQPRLLGVYWTLEIELLFYALCLGLYGLRALDRPLVLGATGLALVWLPRVFPAAGPSQYVFIDPFQTTVVLALATMFFGALFRLVYDETGGCRHRPARWWPVGVLVLLTWMLINVPDPRLKWWLLGLKSGGPRDHITVAAALLIFSVWVGGLRLDRPILTYLGTISYSLYLFHPVAKYTLARWAESGWRLPLAGHFALAGAATVLLAAGVYRWVERPAQTWGKRLAV